MKASYVRTGYCCGLMEIGNFNFRIIDYRPEIDSRVLKTSKYAFICVTRAKDVKQRLWLRARGFKKAGKWKNPNTNHTLTLWTYFPEKQKKKKRMVFLGRRT